MQSEPKLLANTSLAPANSAPPASMVPHSNRIAPGADIRQAMMGELPNCATPGDAGANAHQQPTARAPRQPVSATNEPAKTTGNLSQDPGEAEVQVFDDTHQFLDLRFTDPLIAQIVETWRIRQDMVRAQQKLTLQIKAICRRYCGGDKKEADVLYRAIEKDGDHPLAESASLACIGLFAARQPLEQQRSAYEKQMVKLGRRLPIAHMATEIRGVNTGTLATIVGECGDLSAYRSVSAVWKRAGLAVIGGERQRRVSGDAALEHGYSPARRSVFWNMADALLKSQGKDEAAGPYRQIYDARKAYERERVESAGHAHNRAMRQMTKELLKDLTLEWRRITREAST